MKTNRRSSSSATGHPWRVWAVAIVVLVVLSLLPPASLVSSAPGEGAHALAAEVSGLPTVQAQGGSPLASQTLGRGYWHVFIAYAVAWLLVLGWAISIARRLSKVEREIEE